MRIDARNARRVRLVKHLHEAGPRVLLEILLSVNAGIPLDEALAEYCAIDIETYRLVGADLLSLPIERLMVYDDGRRP